MTGDIDSAAEFESALADIVESACDRLGVGGLRTLFERESGAEQQRRLRTEDGVASLCDALLLQY